MNKQKYIAILLTVVMLLSALPLDYIFAHEGYDPTKIVKFTFGDDKFQYVYFDTEATIGTGTTFRTIGWNIKFRLNSSSAWREVYVPVEPDDALNLNYKLYLSQAGYEKNITDNTNERVKHSIEYYVDAADKDTYSEVQYYGGEWQLNASIQVYVDNNPQPGKIANTFEEALALASWGANTRNDFHTDYYERPGTSKPEPIAMPDFNILYKGNIVNGKTVEKDMADLRIILQDKTDMPSIANPIVKRTWYYWDVASGWAQIPGTGTNDTTVTINDCDSDLSGSKPLKKAFRLDIEDSYDYVYSAFGINYEVAFTVTTGTINVHYTNADTGSAVYPDEIINNVPFSTPKTITNTKATPAGMNLLSPTSQTVTVTTSNPIADVYFLYAPVPPVGEEQGMITVYYKDKVSKLDISQPDIITGDYGPYQVDAIEITDYTLDTTTPSPVSVPTSVTNSKPTVTFLYNAVVQARPPVAVLTGPEVVTAGDDFKVDASESYARDGAHIVSYSWDINRYTATYPPIEPDDSRVTLWSDAVEGDSCSVSVTVTDSNGLTDTDKVDIEVLPAFPTALMDITGDLRENRKITLNSANSKSPRHFRLDTTKTKWEITQLTDDSTVSKENLIINGNAEQTATSGVLDGWNTWAATPEATTYTKRTSGTWAINGTSFEIVTQPNNNYAATYYRDVPAVQGASYTFTGKMGTHRCTGYLQVNAYDSAWNLLGEYYSNAVNNNATVQNLSINFTAPLKTNVLRVIITKGASYGNTSNIGEYVFADDLVLKCSSVAYTNMLTNGNAEQIAAAGAIKDWYTWASTAGTATFTKRTTSDWKISGTASFEIMTLPNKNYTGVYYTDVPAMQGATYTLTGKMGTHRCAGYIYINAVDSAGGILGTYVSEVIYNNATVQNLTRSFTSPANTKTLRVHIVKAESYGNTSNTNEYIFADDLLLTGIAPAINYSGGLTGDVAKESLFKKAGTYHVKLYVENIAGLSNIVEKDISIGQDLKPIADFSTPASILRNPADSNNAEAIITNLTSSPDGDSIWKTACLCIYDSDNNENFEDELCYYSVNGTSWISTGKLYSDIKNRGFDIFDLTTSNPTVFSHKSNQVGTYLYELLTIDSIQSDKTIPVFIVPNDYRRNTTWE